MCTVTYLPLNNNGFVLTSNRDVSYFREKALMPKTYFEDSVELIYPKDGKEGGTWIGTSRNNRLICLLNGGFINHKREVSYPKSRGLIVKELLKAEYFEEACMAIDLENIEPFTMIVVTWQEEICLFEFVWDGDQRHLRALEQEPKIWSSSTLYSPEMKMLREKWFGHWIPKCEWSQENILDFHKNAGKGDPHVNVFMKRKNVGTVSITQVEKKGNDLQMTYTAF